RVGYRRRLLRVQGRRFSVGGDGGSQLSGRAHGMIARGLLIWLLLYGLAHAWGSTSTTIPPVDAIGVDLPALANGLTAEGPQGSADGGPAPVWRFTFNSRAEYEAFKQARGAAAARCKPK